EFFREYHTNTINLRPLGMDLIVTRDHGVMKEMLATGFGRWEKGPRQRQVLGDFFGKGIVGVDGEEWKMHRAMARPYLSKERISDFDIFWKHAQSTIEILEDTSHSDIPVVDIQDLMARFTMDSASEFLFGKCLETLKGRRPIAGKAKVGVKGSAYADVNEDSFGDFATAFESAQIILSLRSARGQLWPLFETFGNKCAPHMRVIGSYLDPIIEKAREEHKQKIEVPKVDNKAMYNEEPTNLLEELVKSIDDPVVLRDEILNMLLAGRDTVATLLTFALYMLSQHPSVEEKLRAEINETWANQDVQPTYALIKKMRYMRAVLDETLRLFPPVGINHRTSSCDTTLPPTDCEEDPDKRPYYVPADTQVTYSTLVMQRSEALWGSDAGEWKPDRWMDAKEAAKHNANFEFVPFNAGPRICIGLNLAYNEASFMLTVLLSKFRFHFAPEYQPQGS
ncbi:cytochrome P450, partial [Serendipita vermifera]